MPDFDRSHEKYAHGIASELATWVVEQREKYLDNAFYTLQMRSHEQDHFFLESMAIGTQTIGNSLGDFIQGYVDLANSGESFRYWLDDGFCWETGKATARDGLRMMGIIPGIGALVGKLKKFQPFAKLLQPSQNPGRLRQTAKKVVDRVEDGVQSVHRQMANRLPEHPFDEVTGGCLENSLRTALVFTGRRIYVPIQEICRRINKISPDGFYYPDEVVRFFHEIGVSSRLIPQVNLSNAKKLLQQQSEKGILLLMFQGEFRNLEYTGGIEKASHLVYCYLDKLGDLKFRDPSGTTDDLMTLLKDEYGLVSGPALKGELLFRKAAVFVPNGKVIPPITSTRTASLISMLAIGTKELVFDTRGFQREYQHNLQNLLPVDQEFPGRIPTVRCY